MAAPVGGRHGVRLQCLAIARNPAELALALIAGLGTGTGALVGSGIGAYGTYEAAEALRAGEGPERSIAGLVLATLSLVVMPLLPWRKRRVAPALGSGARNAGTRQTEVGAWLSAILLAGPGLHAALGWWWADAVAALGVVPFMVREGWQAVRGRTCCG